MVECTFVDIVKKTGRLKVCYGGIEGNGKRWLTGYESVAAIKS